MVKIEKLSEDACVWYMRDGIRQRAYLHQLISVLELQTLEVEAGTVVYSVDEQEVFTKTAEVAKSTSTATTAEPDLDTSTPSKQEPAAPTKTKPKIVFPTKKK